MIRHPLHGEVKAVDKALEEKVGAEQVRQLYSLARIGMVATAFNALVVFYILREVVPAVALQAWLVMIFAITAARLGHVLQFERSEPPPPAAPRWGKQFVIGLAFIGGAWGSLGAFPFDAVPLQYQVFLAFVLGGMTAGAASAHSSYRGSFLAFSLPALGPLTAHFLLTKDPIHLAMGGMLMLFGFLFWRLARHNHRVNRTSLLLRFENKEMIDTLQVAKEDVEGLNRQLLAEVEARRKASDELTLHRDHLERIIEERTADLVRANEQLKAEVEERKQSEERSRLAQTAGRVGVFDLDLTSDKIFWTEQLTRLFGLPPDGAPRRYEEWRNLVWPEDLPKLQAQFRQWIQEQRPQVEFEHRIRRPDGQVRWMAGKAQLSYAPDGTPLRMIGTNVDITESKAAEEILTAAKNAAEAASQAKSEFLANMSHEIRTPLAGAMGMIDLVLEMDIGDEERQLLEMAQRSTDSLLHLIADLLDFSRLEAGMLTFERKPFALSRVLQVALEAVSITARDKGIRLLSTVDGAVPEQLCGDEGRTRQVLVNLLGNAVKFTPAGEIEVRVSPHDAPQSPEGRELVFSVRDTGIGIPPENIEKIFGKFIQIDSSFTRKYGGTGLGLGLSKQIVENWGGRIWVESEEGRGSTFYFTYPLLPLPQE